MAHARAGMAGVGAGLFVALLVFADPAFAGQTIPIRSDRIEAFDPNDGERQVFGPLRFLGGLVLSSPDGRFGGLSGLEMSGDGSRILFVTDKANLIAATPVREGDRLVGLEDGVLNRLIDESGKPMYGTVDAESLAAADGQGLGRDVIVSFERDHRVFRYRLDAAGRATGVERLELPEDADRLPSNAGLEAVAVMPPGTPQAGARVMIAEGELPDHTGLAPGWVAGSGGNYRFWIRRQDGFSSTGAAVLPGGDLIVLERRYIPVFGVSMRLRRVAAGEIAPDAVIDGATLFTALKGYVIDNMEGIAVWRDPAGGTILTIVSDDNFSKVQRTLLLEFALE